jgi:methyl-accepting chemotaxis protein
MFALRGVLERSLAVRWVIYITIAAGAGIGLLLYVAYSKMDYQVDVQGAVVKTLARQKTGERIDSEIELAVHRLRALFDSYEKSLLAITSLRSTQAAVTGGNDVTIAEEIGQRLVRAGLSGAIVLDRNRNVIGADRTGAELVAANSALRIHDMFPMLGRLLEDNDRSQPRTYRYMGMLDASYSSILLAPVQDQYGIIYAVPVFDDFGEPIALVVSYRIMRPVEPMLAEFSEVTNAKIALMNADVPISAAGAEPDQIVFQRMEFDGLRSIPELRVTGRCRVAFPSLRLCVMRPDAEIDRFSQEIMDIGRTQFKQTQKTLSILGLLSLGSIMLVLVILARHLTRPLSEISQAVDRVANGEWRVDVLHTNRKDEIGRIARAISAMQVSLLERDRMRQELIRIDAINQRRLVLDTAVARFEDGMAVVMKNITDTVHALALTNDSLDQAARSADLQAEVIRNTSMVTASKTTTVSRTTLELSRSNRRIGERIRHTSEVVHRSEEHARAAEMKLGEMTGLAHDVEVAMGTLQTCVADLGTMGLKLSLDAMAASERENTFAPFAGKIDILSAKASEAAGIVAREIARLAVIADGATDEIGEVKGVLGAALRDAEEISVAVEEQDAATREIADGLANSASALMGLAESVDHLRESMSSAHEASSDFVLAARRIVEDAKSIDGSVRSFVREVVA